ncbi:hypothetical protein [Terrihalobacillus insolitus]|uniref:hypothetical protein n=1 Tax=Terrihalobacillus insolitus TaxID=2950438 RepID=UPI00234178F3|nr:hypothetical protein [Terrihalobacillus insolitus]MDC3413165.1 hypothetical protein [Terrihalobacillus insolitus]
MNFKFLLFTITIIFLLSIMGCSGIDDTNEKHENDSKVMEGSNDETLVNSSEDTVPKPPSLTVYVGEETIRPTLGSYSWGIELEDGTTSRIQADSSAPPELVKDNNVRKVTADTNVELKFEEQPDSYTVRIWDEENNVLSKSNKVVLSGKGKVIYEVLAHWEQGTASYAFSVNIE